MTLEKGDTTIRDAEAVVRVDSDEAPDKLERILDKTMRVCPVGRLFERAGVDIDTTLVTTSLVADGAA
jgi:hypothetical protein